MGSRMAGLEAAKNSNKLDYPLLEECNGKVDSENGINLKLIQIACVAYLYVNM